MTAIARAARRAVTGRAVALVLAGAALLVVVVPTGLSAQQAVPANTAQPAISGTPAQGQTLTATAGTWDNAPTSFAYQWMRCPSTGGAADASDCAAIGGATTSTYILAAGDVGSRLRVRVTATNADGSTTVASNATALVTATATGPPNTQPPAITGQAVVGQTLTASPGTWTGTGITFAYQWRRCDTAGAACVDISGATATTYALVAADAGHTLRVEVTAKNASGETTVPSAATAVVTTAAPPASGCPSGTGPIDVDDLSSPARLQVDRQRIAPSVVTPGTRTIRVQFHVSACGGRSVEGALVYATATPYQQFSATEQPTAADGWAILTMRQLRYFPASGQQQLLVVFVRARKSGEDLLAGVSTRRLVSFKVNLRG
jgi:hypothetical protein